MESVMKKLTDLDGSSLDLFYFAGFHRISPDFDGFRRISTDFDGFPRIVDGF
jgi:hypothetical protein